MRWFAFLGLLSCLICSGCARLPKRDALASKAAASAPAADVLVATVSLSAAPCADTLVVLALNKQNAPRAGQKVHSEFAGLTVDLPIVHSRPDVWELAIPANALKLLAHESRQVTYDGKLVFETFEQGGSYSPRRELPLALRIDWHAPKVRHTTRARSRAPRPVISTAPATRSAG